MFSFYGNFHKSSLVNDMQNLSLQTYGRGCRQMLKAPIVYFWFDKFMTGLSRRMWEIHKSNLDLNVDIIEELEKIVRGEVSKAEG